MGIDGWREVGKDVYIERTPSAPVVPPPSAGLLGPDSGKRLVAGCAALFGVLLTALTCSLLPISVAGLPILMGAVGSVSVLLFVVPASPFAQPWAIIGGNVISGLVGVAAAQLIPNPIFAAAVSVSGAILAMSLCRCLHPPGGASALAGVMGGPAIATAGWMYPAVLFVDCSILVLSGLMIHRVLGNRYPQSVTGAALAPPVPDPAVLDRLARMAAGEPPVTGHSHPGPAPGERDRTVNPLPLPNADAIKDMQMQARVKWQDRISLSVMIAGMVALLLVTLSMATYISTRSLLASNTASRGQQMQETNIRVAWDVLRQLGDDYRVEGDRLYAGSVLLNGNNRIVDRIKDLVGGSATIFRGDMRVATNVTNEAGERAVGTPLKPGDAYQSVLVKGVSYRGKADILGKPYFTAYDPIKNKAGDVIGVLFVGVPASEMFAQDSQIGQQMVIIAAIMAVLGSVVSIFAVRRICRPLVVLRDSMAEIADNRFDARIPGLHREDEIGAMAKAAQVFRDNGIAKQAADAAKARADREQKMVVDTVSAHLSDLSGGDLTATIKADLPGEFATLKSNFNEAIHKLSELIGSVRESAASINTGSGEIAQASEDLARRTEQNAATLEETAASVEQINGRLKATANAASLTVGRADQAIATVADGRSVADEAVQAMGRVSNSAKGIDSVIEGLDKIAFQTRVLAMNAAVEAGRAGDAGRGFAVVADLVSALAMRAEEEAKRARDQLTLTQTDIVTAVAAVTRVDGALANISGDVGQVHQLLATMAADNQAQSAAIVEISAAVGSMDQATQQNAAMVEQTSAAARNLTNEVSRLTDHADRFHIAGGAPAHARRPVVSAKPGRGEGRGYPSPVKPLPAQARAALVHAEDDWNAF